MEYNLNRDFNTIETLLKNNIPFHFSKYNDGELLIIQDSNSHASRGAQQGCIELSKKLKEGLEFNCNNSRYFVGIPCSRCYPTCHSKARDLIKTKPTLANLLINSNTGKTLTLLKEIMPKRNIVLIVSTQFNIDNFKKFMNIDSNLKVVRVPVINAWDSYNQLDIQVKDNDLVICCCGPLGRVICYELYKNNPTITCLELGSFFDPIALGKSYMYHIGNLPYCEECNPDENYNSGFPDDIIESCYHKERYYFAKWEQIEYIYNKKYKTIKKVYDIHFKQESNSSLKYYSLWMAARAHRLSESDETLWFKSYEKILEFFPDRLEGIFEGICNLKLCENKFKQFIKYLGYSIPSNTDEWLDKNIYIYKMADGAIVHGYYSGYYKETYDIWKKLMEKIDEIPEHDRERIKDNGRYSKLILDN